MVDYIVLSDDVQTLEWMQHITITELRTFRAWTTTALMTLLFTSTLLVSLIVCARPATPIPVVSAKEIKDECV